MSEHPIAQKIINQIDAINGWHEEFEHAMVRTSEEANAVRDGYNLAEGGKALIVRVKIRGEGKKFVMLVLPGDAKFDSKKAKIAINASDLRFAREEEVAEITQGVKPGGVPPFGNLFGIQVFADDSVFEHEKMVFNAGRNYSIGMKTADYKRIVNPVVADIV
jgi:Ala-tRNA(Pro) deacylase